ncbi:ABC transporter ATP-binding protein [Hydromonas duriensis]|uniref:Nucleoside ABC transporter ATP-binding protein n=1 Tax=Hydromonas duriensis TaxID=1527608 RepID=A0A4R6Y7P5_9BURK|nr:ABC transporter ATP-binding protein [Hydromonas duriensis]TDR31380.1 nucleoside ABC transporter ATP-binding protein [Hydromonas duriensis]
MTPARLKLNGMTKTYGSMRANDDISLEIAAGEIHALLGENGAGKSTLMKMIYGVTRPDAGVIEWNGQPVTINSPKDARALGIGMVFQHFSLFETLTVAENIALAMDEQVSLDALSARIIEVSEHYGLPIAPQRLVHHLSVGERQRVEIVRCLLQNPKLLIMDEPTSVLTPQAVEKLFETLRLLAAEGCSIVYISHKLDEIQALCHHATVLRHGQVSGTCQPKDETVAHLAQMMIGQSLPHYEHSKVTLGEERLSVKHLSIATDDPFGVSLNDVSFSVRAGEILGIAGISGNGQAELLAALSGERTSQAEMIHMLGCDAGHLRPMQRRQLGLGLCFVPEERLGKGAVPAMSLAENALLTAYSSMPNMLSKGMMQLRVIRDFAERCIERFKVKCDSADSLASSLSGGNLQKFIMGREIMLAPALMVVAQPTWGVDVGAATFLRQQLLDLAAQGVAIVLLSEELDEIFQVADRIAVLAQGRLSPAVDIDSTTPDQIGVWMSGLFETDAA